MLHVVTKSKTPWHRREAKVRGLKGLDGRFRPAVQAKAASLSETEVKRSLEEAKKDFLWFAENLPELRKKHLNEFVAIRSQKIIASDRDYRRLMDNLTRTLKDMSEIQVEFVAPEDFEMVLQGG